MTWKSTVEFQLIHEDYQRARKGISTLYSDHFDVLSNAKRQLSIILAMPISRYDWRNSGSSTSNEP